MTEECKVNQLMEVGKLDGMTSKHLAMYCLAGYRMNLNPLAGIRRWFMHHKIEIEVHYMEFSSNFSLGDIMHRSRLKNKPVFLVVVEKREGYASYVRTLLVGENNSIHFDSAQRG